MERVSRCLYVFYSYYRVKHHTQTLNELLGIYCAVCQYSALKKNSQRDNRNIIHISSEVKSEEIFFSESCSCSPCPLQDPRFCRHPLGFLCHCRNNRSWNYKEERLISISGFIPRKYCTSKWLTCYDRACQSHDQLADLPREQEPSRSRSFGA